MKIIVCVKQVPDTTEIKIDPDKNTLIRQDVPSIINPFDKNAVEIALQIKEKYGGKVTAISMGPPQTKEALKECIAMGIDNAILLSDIAFGGADTLATSYTLASGIKKLGDFDLIICGKQATDGDTAQVGPEIAEHLNIAQVTLISKIEISDNIVRLEKEYEEGYEIIETKLPLLITVIKTKNEPRYPSIKGMMKASRHEIPVWALGDLKIDSNKIGLKGSPTQVKKIFTPKQRVDGEIIQADTVQEAASNLVKKLSDLKIISF